MKKSNLNNLEFDNIQSYQEVIDSLEKKKRQKHLLIGNGFSMAYDHKIFSYNALYDFVNNQQDENLKKLFSAIRTQNFELIMQQLDDFIRLAEAFDISEEFLNTIQDAKEQLQNSLVDAVKTLHPEHVYSIPDEKNNSCVAFLRGFIDKNGYIFSTNYDLLLYWVLMRNELENKCDGFGKEVLNPEEVKKGQTPILSDLDWGINKSNQRIFYVHGALHLFDIGAEITKETFSGGRNYLLSNIKKRMANKQYPVFVTAGDGNQKLNHIMHNKYLTYCYESLAQIQGSMITFGFNFGDYDEHIIDAINKAALHGRKASDKLHSIYIGVFSSSDFEHIKEIEQKFQCKVNVFRSNTANVWGN